MRSVDSVSENYDFVPMVYPFLSEESGLRDHLIYNKIFVAKYWPNVLEWTEEESLEHLLTSKLVPLPVDQRYLPDDMERIVSKVREYV